MSWSRGNLHAVHVHVVRDNALGRIGERERLARNDSAVGIRVSLCAVERRSAWKARTIYADVRQHTCVAVDLVAREPQFAIVDRKSIRSGRGHIHHDVIRLAGGHEDFALHTWKSWQRVAVFGDQREATGP